ncbi:hypothetical protein llap_1691 [Limosa lapponica baueri]|uniref:Uncharacterized protein n=1 Tax=Limosa lapponica baueri TaxID=1758121 RepID=A0A2I0UPL0_LIMLA|nr:hypothetical protein llap_1691 [Limosa lapponica baueri]
MPASSKMDPSLAKTGPISDSGSAWLRREEKNPARQQPGERSESNNSADSKPECLTPMAARSLSSKMPLSAEKPGACSTSNKIRNMLVISI